MAVTNREETNYGSVIRFYGTFTQSACGSGLSQHFSISDFGSIHPEDAINRLKSCIRSIGQTAFDHHALAVNFAMSFRCDNNSIDKMNDDHYRRLAHILTMIAPTLNGRPIRLWNSNMFRVANEIDGNTDPKWVERGLTPFNVSEVIALYDIDDRNFITRPWIAAEKFIATKFGGLWHFGGLVPPTGYRWTSSENKDLVLECIANISIGGTERSRQNYANVVGYLRGKAGLPV